MRLIEQAKFFLKRTLRGKKEPRLLYLRFAKTAGTFLSSYFEQNYGSSSFHVDFSRFCNGAARR